MFKVAVVYGGVPSDPAESVGLCAGAVEILFQPNTAGDLAAAEFNPNGAGVYPLAMICWI